MKTIAVIPAFNEARLIGQVVNQVKEKVSQVIVVDDGSTDQTAYLARQAGAKTIKHFMNRGQGAALQTGINFALNSGADIVVTFDADGQHVAAEIDQLVKPLLLGETDLVLGSRFLKNNKIPLARKILLKLATFFTRVYTGLKVTDTHNGFRAFSRRAAEKIKITQDGMAHASEIIEQIRKHNLRFKEVGVTIHYTYYSLDKGQKMTSAFKIVWDLILGRLSK